MPRLTDYTGDKNLGSGSNPQIPVTNDPSLLNPITQTGRDLMIMDADRNMKMFQQKVQDRDKLLQLIDDKQVQSGNILPQYRPEFDKAQKEAEDAYFAITDINDLKGREKYNKAVANLKDVANWAQFKTLSYMQDAQDLTKDVSPERQAKRKAQIDKNLKDSFWNPWGLYQQTFDGDFDGMLKYNLAGAQLKGGQPKNVISGQPTDVRRGTISPFSTVSGSYYDYDTILNNASKGFVSTDEKQRYNQEWLRNSLESGDPRSAIMMIEHANQRLNDYNNQRGLQEGDRGFAKPFEIGRDVFVAPDGKVKINVSTPELSAKLTLASVNGDFVEQDKTAFNKDIDESNLGWAKLAEDKRQANLLNSREWAKINNPKTEAELAASGILRELTDSIRHGEWVKEVDNDGREQEFVDISDPTIIKMFSTIDKDGKTTQAADALRYNPENNKMELVYFEKDAKGGVKTNLKGGRNIDKKVPLESRTWANLVTARTYGGKDKGGVNEIIQEAITKAGGLYNLSQMYGKEKNTKKGEFDDL